jgi:hypothetical protein
MPMGMRPQGTRALLTGKTVTTAGVEVLVAVAVAVVVKRLVTVVELRVEHGRPVSVEKTVEVLVAGAEVTWAEMAGATARAASKVGVLMIGESKFSSEWTKELMKRM